jgi:sugar lactone lactonase YvrE
MSLSTLVQKEEVELVASSACQLGESPVWLGQTVHWLDFSSPRLHSFETCSKTYQSIPLSLPAPLGGLIACDDGRLLIASGQHLFVFDPRTRKTIWLSHPQPGDSVALFNDSKIDSRGRLWLGTMDPKEMRPLGSLALLKGTDELLHRDKGFVVSNGPAFNAEGNLMYFADSMRRTIYRYTVDPESGVSSNRRPWVVVSESDGCPDGMAVDQAGFVWSAHWGGSRITRYDPDGKIDGIVPIPASNVTSCCFGGPELRTLYVTTARLNCTQEDINRYPAAGGLFAFSAPCRGVPQIPFRINSR